MPETREWTLMFYFASDNPLAPGIVSQLKTIKQAGFHHEVNVVAQFDPHTEGTPTHIFDVNCIKKLMHPEPKIGFIGSEPSDPFVPDLIEDKLWRGEEDNDPQLDREGRPIRAQFKKYLEAKKLPQNAAYDPPEPPPDRRAVRTACEACGVETAEGNKELDPKESLGAFLKFCRDSYPARHYILFILGHGVVVSNDVFLYDENADSQSLTLKDLGGLLADFRNNLDAGAEFELVSFHSCSVSSLEVAYELHGTANYMLASQGPAFIGSWPYRQILMRLFRDADRLRPLAGDEKRRAVRQTLRDIFEYCYHNSADYLLAGYSFDLCLTDLSRIGAVKAPVSELTAALREGLSDPGSSLVRQLVVLAHWESQSHWQENYTDLRDFCLCLAGQYKRLWDGLAGDRAQALGTAYERLERINLACQEVARLLRPQSLGGEVVVQTRFAGPGHQFSHGLSVYFPWAEPHADDQGWREYQHYKFNERQGPGGASETGWLEFLVQYFDRTMREPRADEAEAAASRRPAREPRSPEELAEERMHEDMRSLVFNDGGGLSAAGASAAETLKIGSKDPTGDECTCGSIKNHPRDTRSRRVRHQAAARGVKTYPWGGSGAS